MAGVDRHRRHQQHVLLQAHEVPSTDFVNNFLVSHSLSQALAAERKSSATGQAELLQRKAQQGAYVEEARLRPKPPLPSIVLQQGLTAEVRRDAPQDVPAASEHPVEKAARLASRQAFLDSRHSRHIEAEDAYEREMDSLADANKDKVRTASQQMKAYIQERDADIEDIFIPLEVDLESLGEKTEEDIQDIMTNLNTVIEQRRAQIEAFSSDLENIELQRRADATALLKKFVEDCTAAAHVVPGELEREVEKRTLALNAAMLENKTSSATVKAKLLVQNLEKSKECKVRWHRGELLWKQRRHRYSIAEVMKRIESNEFKQPDSLVALLAKFRQQQHTVYQQRKDLIDELFHAPLRSITARAVRSWEDRNTAYNDNAQEAFDVLLQDLKELNDGLDVRAESMLGVLGQELEVIDARQEWGQHETVNDIIQADIRPPLQECLNLVVKLTSDVSEALTKQDEAQHADVVRLLAYFQELAKRQETLKKNMDDFEIDYKCKVEECEHQFEQQSTANEARMSTLLDQEIAGTVHHDDLDKLKVEAFDQLDKMALLYREHASECSGIHQAYPSDVDFFFQPRTEEFAKDLGLCTEVQLQRDIAALEEATAENGGEPPEGSPELPDPTELQEWPRGVGSGYRILIRDQAADVRVRVLRRGEPVQPASDDATAADGAGGGGGSVQGSRVGSKLSKAAEVVPRFADGSLALQELAFEEDWLDERFELLRITVFTQLEAHRQHLDRVDVEGLCEEIQRQLDHRLRKHTNRKGAVQVDYYMPRYSTLSKHKDKYERHLVDIARKSQGHEERTARLLESVKEAEQAYQADLEKISVRFPEAETLPSLTAMQREGVDKDIGFRDRCNVIRDELVNLAAEAPERLRKENLDFKNMCKRGRAPVVGAPGEDVTQVRVGASSPDEEDDGISPLLKYSAAEIEYYSGEIAHLDQALAEKAEVRMQHVRDLDAALEGMRKVPFQKFKEAWEKANEDLCSSKGLGREHGEPRRKAQERCRTLNSWGADARQRVRVVCGDFNSLCNLQITSNGVEDVALPKDALLGLRDRTRAPSGDRIFTNELLGTFAGVVAAVNCLGTHLDAFKETHASRYNLENLKYFRVLSESEVVCGEGDEAGQAAEQELRRLCLLRIVGPLTDSATYNGVITSVVEMSNATYASGMPAFMQTFLDEMKEHAERSRLDAALWIRERCDELRASALLRLGGALFGELAARLSNGLRERTERERAVTAGEWEKMDKKRQEHEKRLNPKLANPNNEPELVSLIAGEADRYKVASETVAEDRARMATCLREQADAFVKCLAARFEVAVGLVDALPLHGHFAPLPGDEQVEAPRMSIKRRMRKIESGQSVDPGDGLPERSWRGVPRYELRALLRGGSWPEDEELSAVPEEDLQGRTPAVDSYRSPVHRDLYEQRNRFYDEFKQAFTAEVQRRDGELRAREERENVGDKTWYSMVRQLNPEAVTEFLEARRREAEAAAEAAAAAAAEEAAAADPKKKK
eukprot:TRINITY_DN4175_c1_g1_i2.p1 TRINITY_DN4175_c1_g1~~TRINITY_DN4175_c1_g1_i2.p1  ORF type:complete len:1496 (-),score=409.80 TRINITY_DN4175_c1_g1_i2:405-4892(-)